MLVRRHLTALLSDLPRVEKLQTACDEQRKQLGEAKSKLVTQNAEIDGLRLGGSSCPSSDLSSEQLANARKTKQDLEEEATGAKARADSGAQ